MRFERMRGWRWRGEERRERRRDEVRSTTRQRLAEGKRKEGVLSGGRRAHCVWCGGIECVREQGGKQDARDEKKARRSGGGRGTDGMAHAVRCEVRGVQSAEMAEECVEGKGARNPLRCDVESGCTRVPMSKYSKAQKKSDKRQAEGGEDVVEMHCRETRLTTRFRPYRSE